MRILIALTYYSPHISGLTLHVRRLAEGLAARGHNVTVLTSRHDRRLPLREEIGGVHIVRVPIVARLGKGPVMPLYLPCALPELRRSEVAVVNLPTSPSEAVALPLAARLLPRRPLAAIYHCDLQLGAGLFDRLVSHLVRLCNLSAARMARRIVAYTADFAAASTVLRRFPEKVAVVQPPVDIPDPRPEAAAALRRRLAPAGGRLLGMASRLASEKGIEYLLAALPALRTRLGPLRIAFAGEYERVVGEARYRARLQPLLAAAGESWVALGPLDQQQLADFYAACDLTLLPSVNMTESFGLVQVESMLCGTPVIASDLPGVRVPIRTTGMGILVPPRDPAAIVEAAAAIVAEPAKYRRPRDEVRRFFSLDESLDRYEELLRELRAASTR